ncbi:MAG: polysaccharide deacetylase family protein [Actinophytocola sp.]|uniref:polysaccharide deacetylase family protein n=1 Tax=Actinophytocola sp. TaxID=1872138 RepID=UPI00132A7F75|nr:polysaccharide deacetylase family protein [Actinophytocola sp.]MPZ79529.1 polysaccharide deacetylase family protein [Actinophytocola sp.]
MRSQVLQPPYVYRWGVLITAVVTVVVAVFLALRANPSAAEQAPKPPPTPAATRAATAAAAVPADLVGQTATTDRVVALTFDDGPHPTHTRQVLNLLAEHHAVATFCMVGAQVRRYPELVRLVVDAGMRLCNHTVDHDENLARNAEPVIERKVLDASADLRAAAGDDVPIGYFRAPGGNWSDPLRRVVAEHGMKPLSWSVDPHDWSRPGVARIVAVVKQNVRPGSVVLLHDGGGRRDQTVQALRELLPWFVAQGYRFAFPG